MGQICLEKNCSSQHSFLPEFGLEDHLLRLPLFRRGFSWVVDSPAHPEGQIALHINEVIENIKQLPVLDKTTYTRLRIAALSHDTFKYLKNEPEYKDQPCTHGYLARKFMEQHTQDEVLLDLIELHDEVYYAWREGSVRAEKRLNLFVERFLPHLRLYYLFFRCDTMTGNKTQAPRYWFEAKIKQYGDLGLIHLIDILNK